METEGDTGMSKIKQIAIILTFCILIAFVIADVIAVIHSAWFIFTNIHLTRMEALFDPGNKMLLKIGSLLGTYITGKILASICKS